MRYYNPKFSKRNRFQALECLELFDVEPKNFRLDSPIKRLIIYKSSSFNQFSDAYCNSFYRNIESTTHDSIDTLTLEPWFIRPFPHLERVKFGVELTDNLLTKFLSLNQTLRDLEIYPSKHLSPMILESIASYCQNLEVLGIEIFLDSTPNTINIMHLNGLRKLRYFGLHNIW